ncbi:hypothetical protein S83_060381 [Arachis hypogaea]
MSFTEQLSASIRRSWRTIERLMRCGEAKVDTIEMERKKKFEHPHCNCGRYAILFESGTRLNPSRLFCCCYFKIPQQHCKYFKWLDEMIAENIDFKLEGVDTREQKTDVQSKLSEIEKRLMKLELLLQNGVQIKTRVSLLGFWSVLGFIIFYATTVMFVLC